jgi:hypothetical protein
MQKKCKINTVYAIGFIVFSLKHNRYNACNNHSAKFNTYLFIYLRNNLKTQSEHE